jgi:hypothetical protein
MSLRAEQYRALKRTRQFLFNVMRPSETPRVPGFVRKEAGACIKHFPFLDEHGKPQFSKDPFGPDAALPDNYWAEDPDWPVQDWQAEVSNDDTRLGYWPWVENMKTLEDTDA